MREAGDRARKERIKEEEASLEEMKRRDGRKVAKRLERTKETGAWLSCVPNRFDGTKVSGEEFFDNLAI